MLKKILITGICGFIGSHVFEHFIKNSDYEIVGLDKLTYASNGYDRLRDTGYYDDKRLKLFSVDFTQAIPPGLVKEIGEIDYILHLGAETHVDRSIDNPEPFVLSNILGTMHILDFAKKLTQLKKFFYFSTDEVFGPASDGTLYKETDRYNCTNPYAATKAGAEQLCLAYANTYNFPVVITRCMNAYGERQHPEKYIPSTIKKILDNETVYIHSDPTKTKAGSRFYIHCRNIASALLFMLDSAIIKEAYHIVGEKEVNNLDMAVFIAKVIDKPLKYEMVDFHSSRPGHDLRYSLDGSKLAGLGWKTPKTFEDSLVKTIKWYLAPENKNWLEW